MDRATLGGGCFWCVEAAFEELAGVEGTTSGYAGGHADDPSYEAVCSGDTGHAEVVQVEFDPAVVSYEALLEVFFTIHNPTTVDREGPDVGSQYRSAIYTHSDEQYEIATAAIEELEEAGAYEDSIVTEVEPLETFYPAEAYHQDYFEKNPLDAYCRMHAVPKIEKVNDAFHALVDAR